MCRLKEVWLREMKKNEKKYTMDWNDKENDCKRDIPRGVIKSLRWVLGDKDVEHPLE